MQLPVGTLLLATPLLNNTYFEKSIILIIENNKNGAIGFVINKQHKQYLNNLVEFNYSKPLALYNGGPVETEKLFFIHNQPALIENSTMLSSEIYFGGNFKQAVQLYNNLIITSSNIQIFIGYCGWDALELEAEVAEGSWLVCHTSMLTIQGLQKMDWKYLHQNLQ